MIQGPVLRLVLFMIFINDFDKDMFIKLAVGTRLEGIANMISDLVLSQENLDSLKCTRNIPVKNSKVKYKVFGLGLEN